MNSPNHVLIGLVVYEYAAEEYGVRLDRVSFLKRNTSPDHSLSFLRLHRMRYCKDMVKRKIGRTCHLEWQDENRQLFKRPGVLCHYYSDFFCLVHSSEFSDTLSEYIQCGRDLLFYMGDHTEYFRGLDYVPEIEVPLTAQEIYRHMHDRVHQKYELGRDFETELLFAIRFCIELVLYVFYHDRRVAEPAVQR